MMEGACVYTLRCADGSYYTVITRCAVEERLSEHQQSLERIPIGWNRPIDKNTLKIDLLEHVLIGKVSQLFRNML
jgi:hypothetical protein